MTAIRQILPNYTTEDYERWEGRWEIINGIAISMSPMPSPRHQYIAAKISRLCDEAIEDSGCKLCKVYQPIDYRIDNNTIVNPDISIVCRAINGQYLDFAPALIVEILSPSTALKDRHTKYDLYQAEGVKYYILVDPELNQIETYALDAAGTYKKTEATVFDLEDSCNINIDLKKCFL